MIRWPAEGDGPTVPPLLRQDGPRVVGVGGGHGLAMVVAAASEYASQVTGIVTVADDGGSSGRLTTAMDILPPGDMRRGLLALSPSDSVVARLFDYRFADTDVAGHSLGNLILAALTDMLGDFESALAVAADLLGANGRILPVCTESLDLAALIDGEVVEGQAAIADLRGAITQLVLRPPSTINPEVVAAIDQADQIILGPGSLFTSVLSCLVVPGMVEVLEEAGGQLVYALNLVTQDGETWEMTGADHLRALVEFSGLLRGGTVLSNQIGMPVPERVDAVALCDEDDLPPGWSVTISDLADHEADWPQHDPTTLAKELEALAIDGRKRRPSSGMESNGGFFNPR